jgi:alpha-N-arabinofuranosidase
MLLKILTLTLCLLCVFTTAIHAQAVTLQIDAGQTLGPVNTKLLGQVVRGADRKDVFGNTYDGFICNEAEGLWDPNTRAPKPNALAKLMAIKPPVLRYPGGLITQGHDWKKTIGPVASRPDFQFGLNEYMQVCKIVGAEAQIVLSEYVATPQDLADLVEYLNMPATAQYPWAMKRKADGYPQPYGVKIFELGNETWIKKLTGRGCPPHSTQTYGQFYLDANKAIKTVDPTVKLGLVLANYGHRHFDDPWNLELLDMVGKQVDFVIVHAYAVGYRGNDQNHLEPIILNACMANTEQIEAWLANLNGLIKAKTGRVIPIAMTEFNASFVGNDYRFGYAAALHSADYVRVMLKPQYNVMLANYWHYLNGHFAMVQGMDDANLVEHPAYPLMKLWAQHFDGALVQTQVNHSPTIEAQPFLRVLPANGDKHEDSRLLSENNLFIPTPTQGKSGDDLNWQLDSLGNFTLQFNGRAQSAYPHFARFDIPSELLNQQVSEFRLTCQMQVELQAGSDMPGHIGIGLEDGRGWNKTKSAAAIATSDLSGRWHTVVGEYKPLPDTKSLTLLARLNIEKQNITGTLRVRNIKILPQSGEHFPAYQAITATSALSNHGKTMHVMLMNKHQTDTIAVNLNIAGFKPTTGQYWQVSGPSLAATNTPENIQVKQTIDGQNLSTDQLKQIKLKPLSMTMIQLQQ